MTRGWRIERQRYKQPEQQEDERVAQGVDEERLYNNKLAGREDKRVVQQEDGKRQWDNQLEQQDNKRAVQ
jgi:hypothetical protein